MGMEIDKEEIINKRKIGFRLFRSYSWILAGGVAGAVVSLIIYLVVCVLIPGKPDYTADFTIYLDFAEGKLGDEQYYNGYTWGQIASSDKILGYTMSQLSDSYTKEEVDAAVNVTILADVRVLTGTVVTSSETKTNEIAEATIQSFEHFTQEVDTFDTISLWQYEPARQLSRKTEYVRASALGFACGILITLAIIWIKLLMEDTICTTEECKARFHVPALGMFDRKNNMYQPKEVISNVNYLFYQNGSIENINLIELDTDTSTIKFNIKTKAYSYSNLEENEYLLLRESKNNILAISWGRTKGSLIVHALDQLNTQNINISGVIICDADTKFLKRYYHKSDFDTVNTTL